MPRAAGSGEDPVHDNPTDWVAKHIRKLATGLPNLKLLTLTGGVALGPQLASLGHAPHVVVGVGQSVLGHVDR